MSGWRFRRDERDGRIVMVPRYDGGPDEEGRMETGEREDRESDTEDKR